MNFEDRLKFGGTHRFHRQDRRVSQERNQQKKATSSGQLVGLPPNYTVLQPGELSSSQLPLWEPPIQQNGIHPTSFLQTPPIPD
jgi:hypothetical protein